MRRALFIIFLLFAAPASSQQANCYGFIDTTCCCTNNCCFEISTSDVSATSKGWLIKATNEVVQAKASPDFKSYRCACRMNYATGLYEQDVNEKTRCLYLGLVG